MVPGNAVLVLAQSVGGLLADNAAHLARPGEVVHNGGVPERASSVLGVAVRLDEEDLATVGVRGLGKGRLDVLEVITLEEEPDVVVDVKSVAVNILSCVSM